MQAQVQEWFTAHRSEFAAIGPDTKPNALIASIGDDLLARFQSVSLLDPYDVYEQLLSYWDETMHDDVFLVMTSGWADAASPRHAVVDKYKKLNETPDLQIGTGKGASKYKMDLIPPALIASRYFASEMAACNDLFASAEAAAQAVAQYIEEHAVDEGLLAGAAVDGEKVTKASSRARLKAAREQGPADDETTALERVIALFDAKSTAEQSAQEARAALDLRILKRYTLDGTEARSLVLDDKWLGAIQARVASEVAALTGDLVERIQQLGDRYQTPLPSMEEELRQLSARVADHLAAMGIA